MNTSNRFYEKQGNPALKRYEYEFLNIANILLNLYERKIDFHLSSNDSDAGAFSDICLEITGPVKQEIYIHLEHTDKSKELETSDLESNYVEGKLCSFSIDKYYQSYVNDNIQADTLILMTNCEVSFQEDQKLTILGSTVEITKSKISHEDVVNTSASDDCYQLEPAKDKSKVSPFQDFCSRFYIYANQADCEELRDKFRNKFASLFDSDYGYASCLRWVKDWWQQDGEVKKLNKNWLQEYLEIFFYKSIMETIEFAPTSLNEKEKLLKKIISNFNVSVFEVTSCKNVLKLWANAQISPSDLNFINRLIIRYNVCYPVETISELDDESKMILLWMLNKAPLVVRYKNAKKVLEHFPPKDIIFLLEDNESFPNDIQHFRNLSDIKKFHSQFYTDVLEKFVFSNRNRTSSLKVFFNNQESVMSAFSSDLLLELSSRIISVNGINRNVLHNYQMRSISTHIISQNYFKQKRESSLIVIDFVSNLTLLKNLLPDYIFIDYESAKTSNLDYTKSIIVYSFGRIDFKNFQSLSRKNRNFKIVHKFRYKDNFNFEWISSNSSIDELNKFVSLEFKSEEQFQDSVADNNLNLLTDIAGMGKTEFLINFVHNASPEFWFLLLNSKDCHELIKNYFKSGRDRIKSFEDFVLNKHCNMDKVTKEILKICLRYKKIMCLWDGIDEIDTENVAVITSFIVELSEDNYFQFITSRNHLKQQLETKFKVLSKKLTCFNKTQQEKYIKNRLEAFVLPEKLREVIDKIQVGYKLIHRYDIFAVPLNIFMLTHFLEQNPRYLEQLQDLVVTDLYQFLIDQKFEIYVNKLHLNTEQRQAIFKDLKGDFYKFHQMKALFALLPEQILQQLNIVNDEDSDVDIYRMRAGFISDLTEGKARFIHISFAEYFVAFFFFDRREEYQKILRQFIFKPKYKNIRFFLDLLMAEKSQLHIATIYQNLQLLEKLQLESFSKKDEGGRNHLHLHASWSEHHPLLEMRKEKYTFQHNDTFGEIATTQIDTKLEEIILKNCDNFEKDLLFEMTPLEYAEKCNCRSIQRKLFLREKNRRVGEEAMVKNYASSSHSTEVTEMLENESGETRLLNAARDGHIEVVKLLVQSGTDSNISNKLGETPLLFAARNGHILIVKFLVDSGADINICSKSGETPLLSAVQNGHIAIVKYLVQLKAEINHFNESGETPLLCAARNGYIAIVKYLVESGAEINICNKTRETPLLSAARNGHLAIVKYLVPLRAEMNHFNESGEVPLLSAARNGYITIVKYLVESGAEINCFNESGETPLSCAVRNGHIAVVEYLVQSGAKINFTNKTIEKMFLHAIFFLLPRGNIKMVQLFIEAGLDVNFADENGITLLHLAASLGFLNIAQYLIQSGADIHSFDNRGYTALHLAVHFDHLDVLKFLVEAEADVNRASEEITALHIAASKGNLEIVKFLVDHGADVDRARNGFSPLHLASHKGHFEVIKFLGGSGKSVDVTNEEGLFTLLSTIENYQLDIDDYLLMK